MLKGFQQFILRGNVLDLAVAVVMGAAFGGVVTALVKDLLTPLIAAIVGKPDFSAIAFEVNGSKFLIGDFLNALVSFLLIASAVYFFDRKRDDEGVRARGYKLVAAGFALLTAGLALLVVRIVSSGERAGDYHDYMAQRLGRGSCVGGQGGQGGIR